MLFWEIVGALLAALMLTVAVTPLLRRFAVRMQAVSIPDERRHHPRPTSLFGGVGILLVTALVVLVHPTLVLTPQMLGLLIGLLFILLLGVFDDLYDLSWQMQLLGQVAAAVVLLVSGITIPVLHHPLGGVLDFSASPALAATLLVFWVVLVMNALNWLDGADGIASAVSLATMVALAAIALTADVLQPPLAIIAAAAAGACVGFLLWNRPPASIFLGSAGSFGLGFLIAGLSVLAGAKIATAAMVLLIPLADFVAVLIRRYRAGVPLTRGDRRHLHYLLADRGVPGPVLFWLYAVSALLLGLLGLSLAQPEKSIVLIGIFILLVGVLLRVAPHRKKAGQ